MLRLRWRRISNLQILIKHSAQNACNRKLHKCGSDAGGATKAGKMKPNPTPAINTTNTEKLLLGGWPHPKKLLSLMYTSSPLIHYGCVQNDINVFNELKNTVLDHYSNKDTYINKNYLTDCFAGGFFILPSVIINQYVEIFDEKLNYYFSNNYFIKDDQTIIMDCIFTNPQLFSIHYESYIYYDNWFMFQRILL